jgi:hypothetical protein
MNNKDLEKIIHVVSLDTFTDKEIVREVFDSYYRIIKDLADNANPEDLSSFPIVQLPYIGKFTINPYKHKRLLEKLPKEKIKKNGKDKA